MAKKEISNTTENWIENSNSNYSVSTWPGCVSSTNNCESSSHSSLLWQPDISSLNTYLFNLIPGIRSTNTLRELPYDYVKLVLTDEIFEHVAMETSTKMESEMLTEIVEIEDIKLLVALLSHMNTVRMPTLPMYWSTDSIFKMNFWSNCLRKQRFFDIINHFCFVQNAKSELLALEPLLKILNQTFEDVYAPDNVAISAEGFSIWRGKLAYRRYSSNKDDPGLKIYMLCESDGLCLKIHSLDGGMKGHGATVFSTLIEKNGGIGREIAASSVFTSLELERTIIEWEATVHNRWVSSDCEVVLKIESDHERLMVGLVEHSNITNFDFNLHDLQFSKECPIWPNLKCSQRIAVTFFNVLIHNSYLLFNRYSGGNLERLEFQCNVVKKLVEDCKKEPPSPILFQRLNVTLTNPVQQERAKLLKESVKTEHTKTGVELFVDQSNSAKAVVADQSHSAMALVTRLQDTAVIALPTEGLHKPQVIPPTKKARPRRRCKLCYMNRIRKETKYLCPDCPNRPALCLACFPGHTVKMNWHRSMGADLYRKVISE